MDSIQEREKSKTNRERAETVITLLLQVGADLEPTWTLFLSVRSSSNSNALFPGRNERH